MEMHGARDGTVHTTLGGLNQAGRLRPVLHLLFGQSVEHHAKVTQAGPLVALPHGGLPRPGWGNLELLVESVRV